MYRWVEHTGELELEIDAESEERVFADALEALGHLLRGDDEEHGRVPAGEPVEHAIEVDGTDRPRLLAAWLGELAFLAETEGLVCDGVTGLRLGDGTLHASIHGHAADPPHLVKAVTYHRLAFEEHEGRWRARAVLDV